MSIFRSHLNNPDKLEALLKKIKELHAVKPSRLVFEMAGDRFNASECDDVLIDETETYDTIQFRRPPNAAAGAKAFLAVQDLLFQAKTAGADGNDISIEYLDTGTAGSEAVTVTGDKISVEIEAGVSTAQQILDAIEADLDADALVDITVIGEASNDQAAYAEANLASGADQSVVEYFDKADIRSIKRLRTKKYLISIKAGSDPAQD